MAETVKKLLAVAGPRAQAPRAARTPIEDKHAAAKAHQNLGAPRRRLAGAEHAAG